MPETPTPRLGLFRPKEDGSENVNVATDLNNNFDKIDQYAGFMSVPNQAARLAVVGFVGMTLLQEDTDGLYVLAALPASVPGNWISVQTGVEIFGPLVVADQAARDALVKTNGLEVWRTDRKWLEACDGTGWRVQGIPYVFTVADLTTYITHPYQGQIAVVTSNSGGEYRYSGTTWRPIMAECEIRRVADLSIANAVETAVAWDDDGAGARDPLGIWTSANPTRLTIPVGYAGRWEFRVAGVWAFNATGGRAGWFTKNGVTTGAYRLGADGRPASPATETTCAPYWKGNLADGDYLELRVFHTAGANLNIQTANTHDPLRVYAKRIGPAL